MKSIGLGRPHVVLAEKRLGRAWIGTAFWVVPIIGLQVLASSPVGAENKVNLGINYIWYRVEPASIKDCPTRPSGVLWGGGIIEQYNDPAVRSVVRSQLTDMHRAGFDSIRTFVSGVQEPFKHHKEGLIGTTAGEITPQDQENIKNFISDIVAAGFGHLEITYGFLLESNLFCKHLNYGDCFDPARTEENWRFIAKATELVNSAATSISRRFDLNNEACPSRSMPAATVTNAQRYLSTIASRFQDKFGSEWLISCPDSPNATRLKTLLELLAQSNLTPKYVEIHTYTEDANHLMAELSATSDLARQINASVILGELRYHSEAQAKVIKNFLRSDPNNRIIEILQWPLAQPENHCPIDTSPPYKPGPYDEWVTR